MTRSHAYSPDDTGLSCLVCALPRKHRAHRCPTCGGRGWQWWTPPAITPKPGRRLAVVPDGAMPAASRRRRACPECRPDEAGREWEQPILGIDA